ncbi:MAG TPA: NUDIX domain-containing protein [Puia sp.]|nr:NUDIX domain-containing protein [Puia sp.]
MMELTNLIEQGTLTYLPHISVDSTIFSFHDGLLKVLLLRIKDHTLYSLPGGYVGREEDLDGAAERILHERTGLEAVYLEQCGTFGDHCRTGGTKSAGIFNSLGIDLPTDCWIMQRFISIGYYALVNHAAARPAPGHFDAECIWCPVDQLPEMIFDHRDIARKALETLRLLLDVKVPRSNLLPETFTMNELQQLYESILGKPLLRSNFQRKMLNMDILERLDKKFGGGAHKAPYLYRFKKPLPA